MDNDRERKVDISICLCTYNRADQLQNALESLIKQRTKGVFTFEIVIVDDGSTDSTADVVRRVKRFSPVPIFYVWQSNLGIGTARNRTVKEASGNWVAFFDDDQIASPDWLFWLYNEAVSSEVECIGGPVLLKVTGGCQIQPYGTIRKLLGENPLMKGSSNWYSKIDPRRLGLGRLAIPGAGNALMRKDLFVRMGGFRDNLRYGEDFDLFLRVSQAGIKIGVAPKAVVDHVIPASRLRSDYLLPLAEKAARVQADHTIENHHIFRLLFIVVLRLVHLSFFIFPSMFVAALFKQKEMLLAIKCSFRFSTVYLLRITARLTYIATDEKYPQ